MLLLVGLSFFTSGLYSQLSSTGWQRFTGNSCLDKGLDYKIDSKPRRYGDKTDLWIYFRNRFSETIYFSFILDDNTRKGFERAKVEPNGVYRESHSIKGSSYQILIEEVRFGKDIGVYWVCNPHTGRYSQP